MAGSRTAKASGGGVLVLVGFDELITKLEKANADTEKAMWDAARAGGRVMYNALKAEAQASGVPADITKEIAYQAERDVSGKRVGVKVGWRMPETVDYTNLSAGQKAAILNYGTSSRHTNSVGQRVKIEGKWVTLYDDRRGWVKNKNFIRRAKKKARPQIKEAEKEALLKILKELKQ